MTPEQAYLLAALDLIRPRNRDGETHPELAKLNEMGLVAVAPSRFAGSEYKLTPLGRRMLDRWRDEAAERARALSREAVQPEAAEPAQQPRKRKAKRKA